MFRRHADLQLSAYEFRTFSITVLLMIVTSFGIGLYLPSIPQIMVDMHTDKPHMYYSVTLFILGSAISILVYGPISDYLGRRPLIVFGLALTCMASILSSLIMNIGTFLLLRFLQGVGCGACWGLCRIIAADVMQGKRLAIVSSYFTTVTSFSSMLAPAIGAYIDQLLGWQGVFLVWSSIIFIVMIMAICFLQETNQAKDPRVVRVKHVADKYRELVRERLLIGCTLLTGIAVSTRIVYASISSFIFQDEFSISSITFGWLTAIVGAAAIVGKLITPFFIRHFNIRICFVLGLVIIVISGVVLLISIGTGHSGPFQVVVCASLSMFGIDLIKTNARSVALTYFQQNRGTAGAVFGALQLLIAFLSCLLVIHLPHTGSGILAVSYLVLGVVGLVAYFKVLSNVLNKMIKHTNKSSTDI